MPNLVKPQGWVMAFDFGATRIGIAIGNLLVKIPHPLTTVTGGNKFVKLDAISKLIKQWQPTQLVIGQVAKREDNQLLIAQITKFANRLQHKFKLPIALVNEEYTSQVASIQLYEQQVFGIKQKNKLDQLAACSILQAYFNEMN